jgi:hypothetical protein
MLKGLLAGLLMAGSVYAQDIIKDSSYMKELSRMNIPLSYSSDLIVNKDNTERKICFSSEIDGISDIRKLLTQSGHEESWIYDPKNTTWIETGRDETGWIIDSSGYRTTVSLDSLYIDKLMDSLDILVAYHFHPSHDYPFRIDSSMMDANMKKILDNFGIKAFTYATTAIPSVQDINTMVFEQSKFYREKPYGKINHCVSSYLGVTEYDLTDKAKEFILEDESNTIIVTGLDNMFTSLSLYLRTISSFNKEPKVDLEETCMNNINYALALRTDDFIEIKFYPYRSLFIKESEGK